MVALVATTGVCGLVAGLLGREAWAAVLGATLVIVYWFIERTAARLGTRGSFGSALGIGLAGMAVRFAVVLGALVALGLLARPAFPEAVLSFLLAYSLYQVLRLVAHPALAPQPKGE